MSLVELRDKVQRWLLDMGLHGVEITQSNGFAFRNGSTRVMIDFEERGEGEDTFSVVRVTAPFLQRARPSPELFEWVARSTDDWVFGHLGLYENKEDGTFIVLFTHRLLGDFLDPEELRKAVAAIALTADEIDDDVAKRFNAETFYDD